jgi:Sulfatase-modifying factor enzyme 1
LPKAASTSCCRRNLTIRRSASSTVLLLGCVSGRFLGFRHQTIIDLNIGSHRQRSGAMCMITHRRPAMAGTNIEILAWGDEVGANRANCDGCGSAWDAWKTTSVGSFAPNAFGLHDMHGNVEEWTDDCRAGRYSALAGVPKDLRECTARGGSWSSKPDVISFHQWKVWTFASSYGSDRGFRLARSLLSP